MTSSAGIALSDWCLNYRHHLSISGGNCTQLEWKIPNDTKWTVFWWQRRFSCVASCPFLSTGTLSPKILPNSPSKKSRFCSRYFGCLFPPCWTVSTSFGFIKWWKDSSKPWSRLICQMISQKQRRDSENVTSSKTTSRSATSISRPSFSAESRRCCKSRDRSKVRKNSAARRLRMQYSSFSLRPSYISAVHFFDALGPVPFPQISCRCSRNGGL